MTLSQLEQFHLACGATGPLDLYIRQLGLPASDISLAKPFAIFGHHRHSDFLLEGESVSRKHFYLQVIAGRVYCVNLGSRSGLSWGGRNRVSGWLEPGELLRAGEYEVTLRRPVGNPSAVVPAGAEDWDPLATKFYDNRPMPSVFLESADGHRSRINRFLALVGHSSACKLRLRPDAGSAYHAALVGTAEAFWAVDLLSSKGTMRNGEAVSYCQLEDGDRVSFGSIRVRVWYEEQSRRATDDPDSADSTRVVVQIPQPSGIRQPSPDAEFATTLMEQFGRMQQQMADQFQQGMMMLVQLVGNVHREQMELVQGELQHLQSITAELTRLRTEQLHPAPAPPPQPNPPAAEVPPERAPTPPRPAPSEVPSERKVHAEVAGSDIHSWLTERIETLERERQSRWQKVLGFLTGK